MLKQFEYVQRRSKSRKVKKINEIVIINENNSKSIPQKNVLFEGNIKACRKLKYKNIRICVR